MKVLVTGAGGFLGQAVLRLFLEKGHEVITIARRRSEGSNCEELLADLKNKEQISCVLRGRSFDAVIDIAAVIPGVPRTDGKAPDYFENVLMTEWLLRGIMEPVPSYFLKLSSIDVYGPGPWDFSITESAPPRPITEYATSKYLGELLCDSWSRKYSVPLCILRSTQLFGPGDRGGKFIPAAVRGIKEQGQIILQGDGLELRDYLFVEDAARLIVACTEQKAVGTINLARGESISIQDVIETLRKISSNQFRVEMQPRAKTRMDYKINVERLLDAVGDVTYTPFEIAMRMTYDGIV